MATAPVSRKLNLTRDQLAQFLTDQQQLVNLLGADLLGGGRCAHIDAWGLIAATAQEGDALDVDATGKGADHALLDLSAIDALEWEQVAADVVEHLDGVAV